MKYARHKCVGLVDVFCSFFAKQKFVSKILIGHCTAELLYLRDNIAVWNRRREKKQKNQLLAEGKTMTSNANNILKSNSSTYLVVSPWSKYLRD